MPSLMKKFFKYALILLGVDVLLFLLLALKPDPEPLNNIGCPQETERDSIEACDGQPNGQQMMLHDPNTWTPAILR